MTKEEMKQSTRYPYTYACDWLREAGIALDRSQAAQTISKLSDKMGVPRDDLARILAEQYCNFWSQIEELEEKRKLDFLNWRQALLNTTESESDG